MRRSLFVVIALFFSLTVTTAGQTASSLSLSGLSTSSLAQPVAPSSVTGFGTCSGIGSNTWGYAVDAVDGAGGTTKATTFGPATTGTCINLSNANYFTFTTQAVPGAVSCAVYRTAVPGSNTQGTGYIGSVLCGWPFFDIGATGDGTTAPTISTAGSISATGSVAASSFTAQGTTAGTSVWATGGAVTALPGCGSPPTQSLPCIPSTNAFFLQDPTGGISTSFGWTAPSSANTGYQVLFLGLPVSETGGITASPLSYVGAGSTNQVLLGNTSAAPSFGPLPWNALANPQVSTNQSLAMGAVPTTWTWSGSQTNPEFSFQGGNGSDTADYVLWQAGNATGAKNFFDITDTATNSGTGSLLNVFTTSGSGMFPFTATAGGSNGVQMSNSGTLAKLGSGHVNADECNSNSCPSYTGTPNANDMAVWGSSGALLDDTLLVDTGTALSYAGKFSVSSAGIITKMTNTTTVGVAGMIYDTPSSASSGNITSTQLWAGVGGGAHMGRFSWYIEQTGAGVGCSGSTTVTLNVIYNPPSKGSALTQSLGSLTIALSGNGAAGNFVSNGTYPIGIRSGTAVSYSTTGYTAGTGCTTDPTYTVYPVFELFF